MKKYLLTILMMLALCSSIDMQAQRHRHHIATTPPPTDSVELVSEDTTGIEAYSDTTSASVWQDSVSTTYNNTNGSQYDSAVWDEDDFSFDNLKELLTAIGVGAGGGMLAIVAIVFVFVLLLLPLLLLAFIVWIIIRNRNQRYKLAQQAMENGQQIPDSLLKNDVPGDEELRRKGIRNIFLGVGLAVFFSCWDASFFAGLGWLLFFYGLGQVVIARTSRKKDDPQTPANDELNVRH